MKLQSVIAFIFSANNISLLKWRINITFIMIKYHIELQSLEVKYSTAILHTVQAALNVRTELLLKTYKPQISK